MNVVLRLFLVVLAAAFLVYVLRMVAKGRLLLRYSLLWLVLALAVLLCALFPGIAYAASGFLGFVSPVNFVFLVGVVLLMAVALSLTAIVSKQTVSIKNLTQRIAILENELEGPRPGASAQDPSVPAEGEKLRP